jgi:integrase
MGRGMGRPLHRLSDRRVRTAPPGQYADGGNLYLIVANPDSRHWSFVWKDSGRRREMGLGSLRGVSLSRARELAAQARADVAAGLDPKEGRDKRRRGGLTFGQVAEKVLAALEPGWTNRVHRTDWRRSLTVDAASLADMPIDKIDTAAVLSVLTPLWTKRPETAARLRLRLERALDWARAHGHRSGENPARWRGHLRDLLPRRIQQRQHFTATPFDELPELMRTIVHIEGFAARALEFAILTACRTSEVLGARWDEIDLEAKLWSIPAARMKSRRPHTVPLSDHTVEILRELPRMNEFLFPGWKRGQHLSHVRMLLILRQIGSKATVHGMRASFRTWAQERTGFPREVVEMCLAHAVGDATERAYARGDLLGKRQQVMGAWADFLEGSGQRRCDTV